MANFQVGDKVRCSDEAARKIAEEKKRKFSLNKEVGTVSQVQSADGGRQQLVHIDWSVGSPDLPAVVDAANLVVVSNARAR